MAPPSTVPASLKPGFRLSGSQVIGNKAEGIEIDAVAATGLTIDKSIIAENALEGLFVYDTDLRDRIVSNITDFVIQDSYLGAAPNPLGASFVGNGTDGFRGEDSTFTGVAFLDSFFNGNNTVNVAGGDGLGFATSTIHSGQVTLPDSDMTITTGFTLKDSQAVNNGLGIAFGVVVADDVTIDGSVIAQNGEGILVGFGSNIGDFVIQNSHIGEVRDANGNLVFTRNTAYGIFAGESTFRRVAFLNSDFNDNGIDGIFFRNSRSNSASANLAAANTTLPSGFMLQNSSVVGNAQNGINFDGTTATNVSFDNVTFGDNALDGVFVHNNSNFTNLLIQDSHLGEVLDGDGNQILPGNGGAGFNASGSTFTGVAFLDSS